MSNVTKPPRASSANTQLGWWPTKSERARFCQREILSDLKTGFKVEDIKVGVDKAGNPKVINTVEFEPTPSKDGKAVVPVVLTHGYGSGVGLFFRNLDAIAQIPGVKLYAIDWLGMGNSSRNLFPCDLSEQEKNKHSCVLSKEVTHSAQKEIAPPAPKEAAPHAPVKVEKKQASASTGKAEKAVVASSVTEAKIQIADSKGLSEEYFISAEDKEKVKVSEEFFLDAFDTWRKEKGLEKIILIGHSLGGYLSTSYTIQNPDVVVKLINVSPVGIPRPKKNYMDNYPDNWKFRNGKWLWENSTPQQLVRNLDWVGLGKYAISKIVHTRWKDIGLSQDRLTRLSNYMYAISVLPRSGEWSLNTIMQFGAWARSPLIDRILPKLSVPTAFIYGGKDWMDPKPVDVIKSSKRLKDIVTGPHIIPNGGHNMFLENPQSFNKVITAEITSALKASSGQSSSTK
mmetsp:Transcript_1705/g.2390  ORF Transcript_1705/g.2390 Transcript_1705/m.2390 type:complete len:456 (+) Transcript_1705:85-1452(+)|eukprot:CAMPEP_0167757266 /NCGR_PEP_ID=MMETSP0110_2-20121227/9829_1 /TAXON_ID=629695 /ORGANISM="Gymnochlora sp., Strain CCMP2014" /LENGTH=455 /DNA_ID=CAMNT_0007643435 /DNA_START=70 /DNA_END=1437 /DNA_ORIENTATION=-